MSITRKRKTRVLSKVYAVGKFGIVALIGATAILVVLYFFPNIVGVAVSAVIVPLFNSIVNWLGEIRSKTKRLNSEVVEQVLYPIYSGIHKVDQTLKSMIDEATDRDLDGGFIREASPKWLFSKIEPPELQTKLQEFGRGTEYFNIIKQDVPSIATTIVNQTASQVFGVAKVSNVLLGISLREKRPIWFDLAVERNPLEQGPLTERIYMVELENSNLKRHAFPFSENLVLFHSFWKQATAEATANLAIQRFRKALSEMLARSSGLNEEVTKAIENLR